jgi:hypothetical protein
LIPACNKQIKNKNINMKKTKILTISTIMALCLTGMALFTQGCAPIGHAASKNHTAAIEDDITLNAARADILDVVSQVAGDIKMDVVNVDKAEGQITLESESSMFVGMAIGKVNVSIIEVAIKNEGKALHINAKVSGNFGNGKQDAAAQLLNDFKSRLIARLGVK